ncbi:MAG TPA: HD domain-containing phosphohydrolase, partial [Bryobacteraceae bacterium]|nr:HD domain-containing phosphohydrolase [Bryobacteraceae bacterium]
MGERPVAAVSKRAPLQSRLFVVTAVVLGFAELVSLGFRWNGVDSRRFLIYLAIVAITSFFHLQRTGTSAGFSLNLPFVLLSIVDLSLPEAVTIGCTAAVIQDLRSGQGWSLRRLMVSLGVQATVISTASFVLASVLPKGLQDPPFRLFIAAVSLFVANTFPAAILLRLAGEQRLGRLWKKSYFWAFPYYLVGAALAQVIHLGKSAISSGTALLVLAALYLAYRNYRSQKTEWTMREKHASDLNALHLRAIEGLALAVEAKDNLNTRGHIRRVQVYALGIGKTMGLSEPELEALQAGALLHDIGKLAVPEHILTKPGKLTPEEFAKMKVHPLVGAEIVEQMQFPYAVAPIVRAHHEKWDGSGYPFGLAGDEIPLGARILTVSDWLDAMISDREYRKGIPIEEAMQQIAAEAGKSFDPRVVEALQKQYVMLEQRAKTQAVQGPVLSTEVLVEKGAAPDAGLDLCGLPRGATGGDFLTTINAAAREEQLVRDSALASASLDPMEMMTRINDAVRARIACESLVFFLRHANSLNAEFASGWSSVPLLTLEIALGDGLTGWVGQNLQPVVNGNPAVDPGFRCDPREPLESVLAVPLNLAQGLVGVLALYRTRKDSFTRADLQLLDAAAPHIAAGLQNAMAHRELELRANRDALTGVHNRAQLLRFLDDELARGRRTGQPVALVVAEFPQFRELADSVGYAKLDQLLVAISKGFEKACREYDRLGRISENRFALVLPGMKQAHVIAMLDRLHETVAECGSSVCGCEVRLDLGGAFYPDDGDGGRNLLSVAEGKLEAFNQRWEESLRALIRASRPAVPVEAAP